MDFADIDYKGVVEAFAGLRLRKGALVSRSKILGPPPLADAAYPFAVPSSSSARIAL